MRLNRESDTANWYGLVLLTVGLLILLVLFHGTASASAGVVQPSENVSVYHSPESEYGNQSQITKAINNGTLGPADSVLVGDSIIVELHAPSLAANLREGNESPTDQFFTILAEDPDFRVIQTNPTPNRNRKIALLGPENVTVYPSTSSVYVNIMTGEVKFQYRGVNREIEILGGEEFAVQYGSNLSSSPHDVDEPARSTFRFLAFNSRFGTSGYWYDPLAPNWTRVQVHAQLPATNSLTVRVRLGPNKTIQTNTFHTNTTGLQTGWLDLREIEPGQSYELELVHDGEVTDRYTGRVQQPQANISNVGIQEVPTKLIVTKDGERVATPIDNHTAVTAMVNLSHGGQVQVLDSQCHRLGSKWIHPKDKHNVTIKLWDNGKPIQGHTAVNDGMLIRRLRDNTASTPLYTNPSAHTALNTNETCPPPTAPNPPTPEQAEPPTPTPASQNTTDTDSDPTTPTSSPRSDTPTSTQSTTTSYHYTPTIVTTTPGQPGFTMALFLIALLSVFLLGRAS